MAIKKLQWEGREIVMQNLERVQKQKDNKT